MSVAPKASKPSWPMPPEGGWTADDLDRLPNLPPHTELIDGSLVFVSPQTLFHTRTIDFFTWQLQSLAPADFEVIREFTIDIDRQNRPEPDVVVVRADVVQDPEQTRFPAEAVLLAMEVVSEDSVSRDRETKPLKYARAGIAHYWRVENEKGRAAVHAFELEPTTGAYTSVGIFRERMKVEVPFPVDLDLAGIRMPPRPSA
ncbi:Uma2 family endonuclease [Streptomyces sp. B3I8]|jgi:Uma2 family endonuclease|uniref:Uma2 family endonuclease n=1 Tax=Streptomyces sp. B3I8 TaxID=3042303 RepID=UPI0027822C90|nr:Uma2 family endonuclease [Streptomyces sp. B3I8]MDQ0788521.1 Uma2 family endonuclease [Streptomyces sp. B3I8]